MPRTIDEWISFGRLVLGVLLWIPALLRRPRIVGGGIVLSAVSDMADGAAAKMLGSRSDYSRQLDAVADSVVVLSSIGWMALDRPAGLRPIRRTIAALSAVASVLLMVEWRRYRKFGALHIASARAAAVVGHLYVLGALWTGAGSRLLLRCFQALAFGAVLESAWVILGNHLPEDRSPVPLLQWAGRKLRS